MGNREIAEMIGEIYNGWWNCWKRHILSRKSSAWERIVQEAKELLDKYEHHPLAVHLIQDLLDELEGRSADAEKRTGAERAYAHVVGESYREVGRSKYD